jgi:hypothetical protein
MKAILSRKADFFTDAWHNYCSIIQYYFILKCFFMPGRGDNNQHGSARRGSSNQSSQGFGKEEGSEQKSNHRRKQTGIRASQPSPKTADQDANRNQSLKDSKRDRDK